MKLLAVNSSTVINAIYFVDVGAKYFRWSIHAVICQQFLLDRLPLDFFKIVSLSASRVAVKIACCKFNFFEIDLHRKKRWRSVYDFCLFSRNSDTYSLSEKLPTKRKGDEESGNRSVVNRKEKVQSHDCCLNIYRRLRRGKITSGYETILSINACATNTFKIWWSHYRDH